MSCSFCSEICEVSCCFKSANSASTAKIFSVKLISNIRSINFFKIYEVEGDQGNQIEISKNWEKEQANKDFVERKFDIKLGDWVRISIGKAVFD